MDAWIAAHPPKKKKKNKGKGKEKGDSDDSDENSNSDEDSDEDSDKEQDHSWETPQNKLPDGGPEEVVVQDMGSNKVHPVHLRNPLTLQNYD